MHRDDDATPREVQLDEPDDQLPRRRPPRLSIALWLPAVVGLTVALLLGAFTSIGMA